MKSREATSSVASSRASKSQMGGKKGRSPENINYGT